MASSGTPPDRETRDVGAKRGRREDGPILRGEATYVDDITPSDAVHAAVHRSRFGHARIEGVDTSAAAAHDEVIGVYTAADLAEADIADAIPIEAELPGQKEPARPVLADEKVRHAGEPIALVIAEERYAAHDAVDRIDVTYDRKEAVTDAREALADDAPLVHEDFDDNSGLDWEFGDERAAVDEVFDEAPHTVSVEVHNQRVHPDPIEPRGLIADYDPETGRLHFRMATQMPHVDRGLFSNMLDIPEDRIRVSAPDVGGGFGVKALPYPDHVLVGWAATEVERPVKWVATRTESHLADHHGRAFTTEGEYALAEDGEILGFRTEAVMNMGAYMVYATTPWLRYEILASGPYEIPKIHGHVRAAFTNTGPVAPYRGAGRPEIIYLHERLMDRAADELDIDPAELRRRNFIPADAFPYDTPVSATYDSGDYGRALEKALDVADYEEWRERQAKLRSEGRYLGIGVASFVEDTGQDPGAPETGAVEFDADGRVTVRCGTADQGQGHATTYAGLVADELGVDPERVAVDEGDTESVEAGGGTFGSRSVAVGGSAIAESAREVRERARQLAAHHLETATEDVVFDDGEFAVRGAPGRAIRIEEIAERAAADEYPEGMDTDLSASTVYDPSNHAFAFGSHVAVVEVDPEAGEIEFERYVGVDDCGVQLNPTIVEGQVHGGVAQGIGQALYEHAAYDDNGTLISGSLQDYALPKAFHLPDIEVEETETPSPHNPIGAKGVGEGGAIIAPPTVVNAVVDALEPLGVEHIDMPITAERIWQAVENG